MKQEKITLWKKEEYSYPAAYGFIPFMNSYIHEENVIRPCMIIVPGGAYRKVSPSEAHLPAMEFFDAGYQVFVLAYTVNPLAEPLRLQPLNDISRAVRMIRKSAGYYRIDPSRIALCGFSAGGHLCASLCVHYRDIRDRDGEYDRIPNRPDAAVLSYPVITTGISAHRDSVIALLGEHARREELEYMSLEKQVTTDMSPCFIWQTRTDATVPVENSYLFAEALRKADICFSHHVFSEGVHGMSVATEEWLNREFGNPYTLEQIKCLAKAMINGKTKYRPEDGKKILSDFGLDGTKKEKWTPAMKEQIRSTFPEVSVWPALAECWLKKIWNRYRSD